MRTVSVIGTLLLGAAVSLVNCGGDDSSPTGGTTGGSGGTGGAGGSGGATGGSGGATGGSAGTGGAGGGVDGGTTGGAGGTAGAAGSSGKGGAGGTAGAAGSGGKGGASGAAGGGGKAGSAGAGMTDGGAIMCPATQPSPATPCNVQEDCTYGPVTCTCIDPGPDGVWACAGGPPPDGGGGGGDGGMCPADIPPPRDPCPDSGFLGPCLYESGHTECRCDPTEGWGCVRH